MARTKTTFRYDAGSEIHLALNSICNRCGYTSYQQAFESMISQAYRDVLNNDKLLKKNFELEAQNSRFKTVLQNLKELKKFLNDKLII